MYDGLRRRWNETCKAAGLVAISRDKAARLLAVVYVYGGETEAMTHSPSLMDDLDYVQDVYGFRGGMVPDGEVVERMGQYIDELDKSNEVPEWAAKMMYHGYGVDLR